ncbi:DEAD/DEAH box helicase [Methylocystis parvus]|uniref:DEAD/DEAH box helicase n=1 Tax=Methylocystis parvus TaxID=134 RepID=A0A6B8M8G6_9HYPH|nr:DEAD/DEAH box helicase [Methylocystis parvus]QGM97623.1 DEAD/DEAH box helicase [Methylocystis parvus]WBJ98444.1 DEAD/DEAH box helicase [Methylocystis parvus OBBP]
MTFFNAGAPLARALSERDYTTPTAVQSAVLAHQSDSDILVSAQTGSGKTVAYGLAIAPTILGDREKLGAPGAPGALIIAPTRELALQVERELQWLYHYAEARIVACVGGMDARLERRKLSEGAHIVVGTPGRLRDHIERGGLVPQKLKAVVLDEADEMLDLGFREDLEFILDATPPERRTLLFSATMPKGIAALARRYQRDARRIDVAGGERGHADIDYRAIRVAPNEIEHATVNLLRYFDAQTAIVFCNTRESVRHLHATLVERGFAAVLLSGELSQHERNHSMQALRDGRAGVCVATDVAARGIDLPNLGLVIHADLPHDAEALQHRSGRTGRAGRKGVSALLVPAMRARRTERLLAEAGVEALWSGPPLAEEIRKLDQQRMLQDPLLLEPPSEDDLALGRIVLAERQPEEIAAALVRLYRSRLPAIEDVADPGETREFRPRRESARSERAVREPGKAPRAMSLSGAAVWFRLDIGRSKNADPKWLLPMLCRKANITRDDIGTIRIFDQDTRVQIAESAADDFAANMRRPGGDNIRVERLAGEGAFGTKGPRARDRNDRPPRQEAGPSKSFPPRERRAKDQGPRQGKGAGKGKGSGKGKRARPA